MWQKLEHSLWFMCWKLQARSVSNPREHTLRRRLRRMRSEIGVYITVLIYSCVLDGNILTYLPLYNTTATVIKKSIISLDEVQCCRNMKADFGRQTKGRTQAFSGLPSSKLVWWPPLKIPNAQNVHWRARQIKMWIKWMNKRITIHNMADMLEISPGSLKSS